MAPLSGTDTHLRVKEMVLTLTHKEEPLLKIGTFLGERKVNIYLHKIQFYKFPHGLNTFKFVISNLFFSL